ncbi:MAG: helicase-exonuclease AddAB subunit AddA [Oscillospiraceae bacterium]|nr:helicase-exonuclease AddAB subunit AddA [Oscillospiraceae bacterium]
MAFQLTPEQHTAVYDRGGGLLVAAAAGSGKTRVLVERLLSFVGEGVDVDRFLVITYTKAAAAELRGRIVTEIADRLAEDPADANLRRQATLVYKAQISTIDAFCAQFLREEGHRLELDHDFRLCDENEGAVLLGEALNEVLDRRYEEIVPGSDFALLVDTMSAGRDDSRLMEITLDVRRRIQSHPDPEGWLREQEEVFALRGVTDAGETPWGKLLLSDARRQADYWAGRMLGLLELAQGDEALEKAYGPSLQATMNALLALSAATQVGWDETVEKMGRVDFPRLGGARNVEDEEARERIKTLRDQCKRRMEKLSLLFADTSEGLLEDMGAVYPAIRGLFALVRDLEEAYSKVKRRRGILDFSDLEHLTAKLLVGERGEPTPLARRWGERYREVMVDEYQDTNAVQNALFTALTQGGRNLFMVGDVKQSIYRFRLADPTIFLGKYLAYTPVEKDGPRATGEDGTPGRILLSRNFRSRPQVLEGVNYLFRAVMSETFGEMAYGDGEALIPREDPFPGRGEDYALELDLLDGSQVEEEGPKSPRDLLEARFTAERIRELLAQGFPVSDEEGGTRPVRPEDVVILLRSPGSVLHHYAGALGEQDIPWSAEGAGDFFAATEIQVALSLLRIIDNPRQDVALIAALRSAVYLFSADRLAQIRAAAPGEEFYTALTQAEGEDVAAFLTELRELRRQAGDQSCAQLLWQIYDRTNLLGIYGAMEEGETRRANLLLLTQLAREFEGAGHRGLFGFLAYLQRLEEEKRPLALPGVGGGGSGVRIMSVHRSKGLEFPVVILAGLSRQLNKTDMTQPMLFHPQLGVGPKRLDLERMVEYPTLARLGVARKMEYELSAEELRLLYVAMTRAKEKLIMTCALTRGWREVEKLLPSAGAPVEPQALLDCLTPAQWVLLPALARPEAEGLRDGVFQPMVAPGTEFGAPWDIRWVDAAPYARTPSPRKGAGERKEEGTDPEVLLESFRWRYPHEGDVELPSKLTATQLKGRELDEEAAQEAPRPLSPLRFDRPRFAAERLGLTPAEKGTALHLVMQYIDFDRCGSVTGVEGEIRRLVEERFITPQQAQAVEGEKVYAFFASELGRQAMGSGTLRREFKFSVLSPAERYYPQAGQGERVLLQGVVDCYFETGSGITVVDFKTDHVYGDALLKRAEEYRPQLEAYGEALGEITGKAVCRRVLWFFSEERAVEV